MPGRFRDNVGCNAGRLQQTHLVDIDVAKTNRLKLPNWQQQGAKQPNIGEAAANRDSPTVPIPFLIPSRNGRDNAYCGKDPPSL